MHFADSLALACNLRMDRVITLTVGGAEFTIGLGRHGLKSGGITRGARPGANLG